MKATVLNLLFALVLLSTSAAARDKIDLFIMDYPHGEDRIHVKRTGEAYLYYGAKISAQVIKKDTFSAESLYKEFKQYFHPNVPREQWPNPKSQAGMVTVRYTDGKEDNFLIFDLQDFTEKIFDKAKQNIIGDFFSITQPDPGALNHD